MGVRISLVFYCTLPFVITFLLLIMVSGDLAAQWVLGGGGGGGGS